MRVIEKIENFLTKNFRFIQVFNLIIFENLIFIEEFSWKISDFESTLAFFSLKLMWDEF